MMSFSEFMKKTRTKAEVTQRKLSDETGYSVAFVGAWEQGKAYPPKTCFAKLAKLLNIDEETIKKEVMKCKIKKIEESYN